MRAMWVGLVGAVLACSGAQALTGEYQGFGPGRSWQLHAKITPAKGGLYKITLSTTNPTCGSQTIGTGRFRSGVLAVTGECPLMVAVKGRHLSVKQGAGCEYWHGLSCRFDGTLRKVK